MASAAEGAGAGRPRATFLNVGSGGGELGSGDQAQNTPRDNRRSVARPSAAAPSVQPAETIASASDGRTHATVPTRYYASAEDEEEDDEYEPILFAPWEKVRTKRLQSARMFLFETLWHAIFLTLFCLVSYELRSPWSYWMSETIRDTALRDPEHGFMRIRSTADFYDWAEEVFLPGLMSQQSPVTGRPRSTYEQRFAARYNRIIGAVRFRQVRVRKNTPSCQIAQMFLAFIRDCYPPWNRKDEMTEPYGPLWNRTLFLYQDAEALCEAQEIGSSRYCKAFPIGRRGDVYPAGGYVQDFPINITASAALLHDLRRSDWIDAHTRAVLIDFTMFNTNVRLLTVSQLMVEWFPTGRVYPMDSTKPITLLSSELPRDVLILVGEVLLTVIIFGYVIATVRTFFRYKRTHREQCLLCRKRDILRTGDDKVYYCTECDYPMNPFRTTTCIQCQREYSANNHLCWRGFFQDLWNWLDIVNIFFFIAVFAVRYDLRYSMGKINFNAGNRFVMLYPMAWQYVTANYLSSVNALLLFAKSFKFLGKVPKLRVFVDTLYSARGDVGYFLFLFALLFVGFGLTFHLAFGLEAEGYRNFNSSLISLIEIMLGEFRYDDLERANRLLAPIYLIFFTLVVVLVLSSMFVAIIGTAYAASWERFLRGDSDFYSSALRLYWHSLRSRVYGCFGYTTPFGMVKTLLENLERSLYDSLTNQQMDELRTFRNEVEHFPDNEPLFNAVLRAFNRQVDQRTYLEDFEILRDAVREHKLRVLQGQEFDDELVDYNYNDGLDEPGDGSGGAVPPPSAPGGGILAGGGKRDPGQRVGFVIGRPDSAAQASASANSRITELEGAADGMRDQLAALIGALTGREVPPPRRGSTRAPEKMQPEPLPSGF
eukprot:TRINITY_DN203_c0_g1_i1.p1 TRINITY_DN203_c0_g1~~TRINITY_DN203_c0_g1_i1.p1  ORF type:complete len:882 (+),score=229.10 TRINITY_DN203_c0_g1_i1:114-2759(+)